MRKIEINDEYQMAFWRSLDERAIELALQQIQPLEHGARRHRHSRKNFLKKKIFKNFRLNSMLVYFREKSGGAVNGFKIGSKNGMQIES